MASLFRAGAIHYNLDATLMRKCIRLLGIFFCAAVLVPSALAKKTERPLLQDKIMQANSVYVDCVCPRGLAVARDTALQQLQSWGRFQISQQRRQTDLVFLFSGNPYLGDYITRDGPDNRPVKVDFTIMTVIDPNTGQTLWTDSRRWGILRVRGATKDLIEEFRQQMEEQLKRWTLDDILLCSVTPVYAGFAHLSPEEALAKSNSGSERVSGTPEHLLLTSPDAPAFCKRTEFLLNPERRIIGFEVLVSRADDLDVGEVLRRADQFDFAGGKYSNGEQVYFNAQAKDRKILIQFNVDGRRSILSRVSFFYQ
jgi:hypothetical protein